MGSSAATAQAGARDEARGNGLSNGHDATASGLDGVAAGGVTAREAPTTPAAPSTPAREAPATPLAAAAANDTADEGGVTGGVTGATRRRLVRPHAASALFDGAPPFSTSGGDKSSARNAKAVNMSIRSSDAPTAKRSSRTTAGRRSTTLRPPSRRTRRGLQGRLVL